MTDVKQFWEGKILGWERGRYDTVTTGGFLERLADRASDSLRFRLQSAGEQLAPFVEGKRVLDLGCGSGRLADAVLAAGAAHYRGIDIAEAAIAEARTRTATYGDKVAFHQGVVSDLPELDADIVVSLGLLDWLTDDELDAMWAATAGADFVHAIAERRAEPAQWIHRAYVWMAYGHRTGSYVPRYYDAKAMAAQIRRHQPGAQVRAWRHRRLTFGAYLTTLPFGDPV